MGGYNIGSQQFTIVQWTNAWRLYSAPQRCSLCGQTTTAAAAGPASRSYSQQEEASGFNPKIQAAPTTLEQLKMASAPWWEDEEGGDVEDDDQNVEYDETAEIPAEHLVEPYTVAPVIRTGGSMWAKVSLKLLQDILDSPQFCKQKLHIFSFQAKDPNRVLEISLDKTEGTDQFAATLAETEEVASVLRLALLEALGVEVGGDISITVQSPGADRKLEIPSELLRFSKFPLNVAYIEGEGKRIGKVERVLQMIGYDEADDQVALFQYAHTKCNRANGQAHLSRKLRDQLFKIRIDDLRSVSVHIDI